MTVYPFIIRIGSFEITGYGLMMMAAFLCAGWLIGQEVKRRAWNVEYAGDLVVAAVLGGIVGAKLWYVVLTADLGALLSRGGLVWYGGFLGGAAAVLLVSAWRKVPMRWTMQLSATALPAAYAVGRVGCFLVQDDYGVPTSLPWGMKFPEGLPPSTAGNLNRMFGVAVPPGTDPSTVLAVHPTQLYEVAIMLAVFAFMWPLRKRPGGTGWLFGVYLIFAGLERFVVEIFRAKDDRFLGPFTVAQLTSALLVIVGTAMYLRLKDAPEIPPGEYLAGVRAG